MSLVHVCVCVFVCVCVCVCERCRPLPWVFLGCSKDPDNRGKDIFKKGEKGTFYYLFITRFYGFTLSAIKPQ